jgi:hypothetical protein
MLYKQYFEKVFPDASGCISMPVFVNSHSLSKLNAAGIHETTYEKVPKPNPAFKGKNLFYDPWNGSKKDAIWRFHKNPNAQICTEAVQKLITSNISIETTINDCKDITKFVCVKNVTGGAHKDGEYLGKTVRWYYAKNVYGTINYLKSDNKVPDTEGAKSCMDLPKSFPDDINYKKYIDKTTDMLYDINYLKRAKQISFF